MYNRPDGYAGKVGYLVEQFQAHGLLFGGIQEARTPEGSCKCQNVLRFCSGALQGQGGVELWINTRQPYGYEGRKALHLRQEHIQIIHADPHRLLARVYTSFLDIHIFVAHAPHSGHSIDLRTKWWQLSTDIIQEHCGENKPYVMIDANAETGSVDGLSVLHQPGTTSKSTPLWRQFLEVHQLALPQTLYTHVGGLDTWTSPDGNTTHCLDYVAVPCERLVCCTHSQLLDSFDLGNEQQDHTPIAVELGWAYHVSHKPSRRQRAATTFDRAKIRNTNLDGLLSDHPATDWALDVDTQIETLNQAVHKELHRRCPTQRKGPKKSFISDAIWSLRSHKLRCRRALKHTKKIILRELLATAFGAWKRSNEGSDYQATSLQEQYMTTLLCGNLRCLADFRSHAKQLKDALKAAKFRGVAEHIDKLAPTASASTILHTLRPLVGISNLKNKGIAPLPQVLDREDQPCRSPEDALNRWIEFFGNMEGGVRRPAQPQRDMWIQNLASLHSDPVVVAIEDLLPLACA